VRAVLVAGGAVGGSELALEAPEGLFGLYMQAEGSGVVVKKEGTVSVNPATGQITTRFKECRSCRSVK
jgi:hypothetical protein